MGWSNPPYPDNDSGEHLICTEPELIQSPLSQAITRDGHTLQVDIFRLEDETDWLLEVVNEDGTSHVWDDRFATDQAEGQNLGAVHAMPPVVVEVISWPSSGGEFHTQRRRAAT